MSVAVLALGLPRAALADAAGLQIASPAPTSPAGPASAVVGVALDNTPPHVTVAAAPSLFSPNGDGRLDVTTVRAGVSEPSTVTVRVTDGRGATIATLASGRKIAKGTSTYRWNGLRAGHPVADGTDHVVVTATDLAGNPTAVRGP